MAERRVMVLEDDLDGGKADETVMFSIDGVDYQIDLSRRHAKQLRDALVAYTGAGRRQARVRSPRRSTTTQADRAHEAAQIRVWAAANGYELSDRGRIPVTVRAAYLAATS